jgi:hypothetical protein
MLHLNVPGGDWIVPVPLCADPVTVTLTRRSSALCSNV